MRNLLILLFAGFVLNLNAQNARITKEDEVKGLHFETKEAESNFNFRMAVVINENKKTKQQMLHPFSLHAHDLKAVNLYLNYVMFHIPGESDNPLKITQEDYSYPLLLNERTNNFVIGPLFPAK
ncbi:MAG: hypothetical protein V4590_02235 [Bacteroidota bacterium]